MGVIIGMTNDHPTVFKQLDVAPASASRTKRKRLPTRDIVVIVGGPGYVCLANDPPFGEVLTQRVWMTRSDSGDGCSDADDQRNCYAPSKQASWARRVADSEPSDGDSRQVSRPLSQVLAAS